MADKFIMILDSDSAQVEFFKTLLAEERIDSASFNSIPELFEQSDAKSSLLILVNYQVVLAADRSDVISLFQNLKSLGIVVYNVPENANRRLAFYDLGALRVYDSSYSPQEVFYSIKWLIEILSSDKTADDAHSHGRLEEIPVKDLILLLGRENRTGVLKIISNNNSGKLYFFDGNVDAARVGTHSGTDAVLHMLLWRKGDFTFNSADHLAQETKINLSNYGLLILAEKFQHELQINLNKIGKEKSVLRVKHAGDLVQADLKIDQKFIDFIRRPCTIGDILENPFYTSFETAKKLVELKEKGFLLINEPMDHAMDVSVTQAENEADVQIGVKFSAAEAAKLRTVLNIEAEKNSANLFVLFNPDAKDSAEVQTFIPRMKGISHSEVKGVTQLTLGANYNIYLLGLDTDQNSIDFILNLEENDFHGYIFLVDAARKELYEYTNYIISNLLSKKPLPAVVAVYGIPEGGSPEIVQNGFFLPDGLSWIACPPEQQDALYKVLNAMQPAVQADEDDADQQNEGEDE